MKMKLPTNAFVWPYDTKMYLLVTVHPWCNAMVGILVSNMVDFVFDPWSGQTKDYEIGIYCFSAKHAALTY